MSVRTLAPARVLVDDRPELRRLDAMIRAGRCLLVPARISDEGGARALAAIEDSIASTIRLLDENGVHIGHLLPSPRETADALRTEGTVEVNEQPNGEPMTHTFLTIDRRASGLVVQLTLGSGSKVTNKLRQPAVDKLIEVLMDTEPAGVFTVEPARLGRASMDGVVEALFTFEDLHGERSYFGAENYVFREFDDGVAESLGHAGVTSLQEARTSSRRMRRGKITAIRAMAWVNQRCRWPLNQPPMPGLGFARLKDPKSPVGRGWAYLDRDGDRPPDDQIVMRFSDVRYPADHPDPTKRGREVDQVANVEWFLAHYGTPGWGPDQCARHLQQAQFSTPSVRRRRGPAATVKVRTTNRNGSSICRAILDHLDEYEACELHVGTGTHRTVVTGVSPGPGGWARAEDYARIRAFQRARRISTASQRTRVFSGLALQYNDGPARLVAETHDEPVRFQIHGVAGPTRATARPTVTHQQLAELVSQCIRQLTAAGGIVPFLDQRVRDAQDRHRADSDALNTEIAELTSTQDRRLTAMDAGQDTGSLTGAALAALNDRYNRTQDDLAVLRDRVAALDADLAAATDAAHGRGVALDHVLELVSELRDPFSTRLRTELHGSIAALTITDTPHGRLALRDVRNRRLTMQLALRDDEGRLWSLQASLEHLHGPGLKVPDQLATAVDGLHHGRTLDQSLRQSWRDYRAVLRASMSTTKDTAHFPFGHPDADPRLLALTMAIVYPPPTGASRPSRVPGFPVTLPLLTGLPVLRADLPALADTFAEPLALVQRIHRLYAAPPKRPLRYLLDPAPIAAACYPRVDEHGRVTLTARERTALRRYVPGDWLGLGHADTVRLRPCACGPRTRRLSRLREVDTSICLTCRTDRAGVAWPADPYDRYLA